MQRINNTVAAFINYLRSILCRVLIGLFLLSAGCTGTTFVKDGQTYYGGAKIIFNTHGKRVGGKKSLEEELQTLTTPKPNNKIAGMRPGVWFYNIAGTPKKKKGFRAFLKNKLGQPPVLLSDVTPERTAKVLNSQLYNDGYFQSSVRDSIKTKRKESQVIYTIDLSPPYRLDTISYPQPKDSIYASALKTLESESLLKVGQRYDLGRMQAEQERIEEELENYGFYYFDDRFLIFEADSTVGNRRVNLRLRLEPGIPKRARKVFSLNQVNVFPDFTLTTDTLNKGVDTVLVNGINYIDNQHDFRPEIITGVINLTPGQIYSREAQQLTLSHLMGLGVFKFVNIKFSESYPDSTLLNTNIYLTPLQKNSLRAEMQAISKSNNFVGPGISSTFTNRNFFRGAELFQLKLNAAYEFQINGQNQGPLNSFETGVETSLTIPRFISPIRIDYNSRKYLPKTIIKLGFNFQNRVNFYRLSSFNLDYGYIWRESADKSHELYPAGISYVRTDKKSDAFSELVKTNPLLANSFENQFIIGTRYSYTVNTQLRENRLNKFQKIKYKTHNFYFNGNIDVAGNLINLVQNTFVSSQAKTYELLGSAYSQFVKGDIDFRHYWQLDDRNKFVSRVILGAGYAYNNSSTLPYIKQFSIGGSNSLRAFPARSVGPGTYDVRKNIPRDSTLFIDQRGDLKLEGNIEYRFDIIKSLKGALFLDAGNIWLWKEDTSRPGSAFKTNEFLGQLAVGTGIGLRMDFSFFVLRFDTAFPIRKPGAEKPWVINEIDFGSKTWRQDNIIFNIAIGYPF